MKPVALIYALVISVSAPALAEEAKRNVTEAAAPQPGNLASEIDRAFKLMQAEKRDEALAVLDSVILEEQRLNHHPRTRYFSARSPTESIVYTALPNPDRMATVVLDESWGLAHFLKGFIDIDLGRKEAAKAELDRAIELSPLNSHFLGERGEWFKSAKRWDDAYRDFASAADAAAYSPQTAKNAELGRAWRGMAYVLSEQRRYREAETLLRKCLELDSSDEKAKHELQYVHDQLTPKTS